MTNLDRRTALTQTANVTAARRGLVIAFVCATAACLAGYFATAATSQPAQGGYQQFSMQVGGQQRSYVLIRPPASGPLPTVVFLHGRGGNAERMRWTGFDQVSQREGFVTVLPNGLGGQWNVFPPGARGTFPWMARGGSAISVDTGFIKQLVADLIARQIADPNRIYIGGVSNGGIMALRMVCDAPGLFAAVGVVSASMPDYGGQDCHPPKPLPLVMINGTADDIVPYAGGATPAGLKVWGTNCTLAFFQKLNGCGGAAQRSLLQQPTWRAMPLIVVDRWSDCSGAPLVLYSVVGGGHEDAGGRGAGGGFSTAQTLWDFFRDKTTDVN